MSTSETPLLSVCIIFKNEIRCLERCLRSFRPLRERLPLEIVMADTGATDGSRAVAERYADVLVDFPWINDFSAARNAVLERCSGAWCLMADCDEWLDADTAELERFLRSAQDRALGLGRVVQRNYHTRELDDNRSDFMMGRLLRMDAGPRYQGTIHEYPVFRRPVALFLLPHTVLHHDGYVDMGTEKGKAKRDRNLTLLRAQLERDPEDLRALMQYIETGSQEPDLVERLRFAVRLVLEQKPQWEFRGASILRYGALIAAARQLPEQGEWAARLEELFPDSVFTRIDLNYLLAARRGKEGDYAESLRRQRAYLEAFGALEAGDARMLDELGVSGLQYGTPYHRHFLELMRAQNLARMELPEQAAEALGKMDFAAMNGNHVRFVTDVLHDLRVRSGYDTAPLVRAVWDGITRPEPTEARMEERKASFLQTTASMFSDPVRVEPERRPWTLFLPLEGVCAAGDAAAVMASEDPARLTELLARQEALAGFPAPALAHALKHGVRPPFAGRALDVEEIDALAGALTGETEALIALTSDAAAEGFDRDWQSLLWARGLVLTALQSYDWKEAEAAEGLALLRAFAAVERAYLPRCFAPEAIEDGHTLPPAHRFGRCCVRAFDALDAGDDLGAVRALRAALDTAREMKAAVQFLLDEVQRQARERAKRDAPPELLALAEKVRTILAACPPDDPAVAELKASEAYRKVSYLLEE